MKTKLLCGLIASVIFCGVARSSELLTYLASTPLQSPGTPRTLMLQGFNPDLGTLTEVNLTYWGQVVQRRGVENTGNIVPFTYTLSGTANLSLTKSSGGPVLFTSPSGYFSFSESGSITETADGVLDFGGLSGYTLERNTIWSAPAPYLDTDLVSYLTTGFINFSSLATSTGGVAITGGDGTPMSLNRAAFNLQVEYTYSPIPEPATYAAWLGLVVLGASALRRRARLTA